MSKVFNSLVKISVCALVLSACDAQKSREEAVKKDLESINYVLDPRTDLCFATTQSHFEKKDFVIARTECNSEIKDHINSISNTDQYQSLVGIIIKKMRYFSDSRSNICFAKNTEFLSSQSAVLTSVPCSDKVLKLINPGSNT